MSIALRPLLGRTVTRLLRSSIGIARPLSGRRLIPLWGIVHHRGRHSGLRRATPVAIRRTADGFVIALPFEDAQWPRNVLAAGGCMLRWKGRRFVAVGPRIVDRATAGPWFNPIQRAALRALRVDRYLELRDAPDGA